MSLINAGLAAQADLQQKVQNLSLIKSLTTTEDPIIT
jgi:hypothetical protein